MAAPSSTTWGSIVTGDKSTRKGRIGIYTGVTTTNTQVKVTVQVWFWSMYSIDDSNNEYYYNAGATTATTKIGAVNINHTVASGSGWSTSNQTKLGESSYTYNRGNSATTVYYAAKLASIDVLGSAMTVSKGVTIPALASYAVKYNANGGSGAPSAQTKWYGTALTLSSTKPTRTGYSFQGWATSASGSVTYAAGASYTANAAVTLYAVWKANTYAVTYNANGGSGAPASQTKTYGVTLTLSSTAPTRTNYTFKGWATSKSSATVSYRPGGSYTANAAVTLYAVWELAYTKPRISNLSATRCDSEGNPSETGKNARVKFGWGSDKSSVTYLIEWLSGDTVIGSAGGGFYTSSGNVNDIVGSDVLDADTSYTIRVTVTDSGGEYSRSVPLSGVKYMIDCKSGGGGIAFGKPAEVEGYADFGFDMLQVNNQGIYGRDLDGNIKDCFKAQNENGNTVVGWDNYNMQSGNTNIYGHDVFIGVSNIADPGTYRPYRRQGDTLTFTLRTAGYVTNGGKDVTFLVPFAVPIIGAPTAVAASVQGLVLRQNNAYTHGSGASVYVTPDSYSASVSMFCGVYVTAHFTDTTNVVNNAPIGVYWNGTITFS